MKSSKTFIFTSALTIGIMSFNLNTTKVNAKVLKNNDLRKDIIISDINDYKTFKLGNNITAEITGNYTVKSNERLLIGQPFSYTAKVTFKHASYTIGTCDITVNARVSSATKAEITSIARNFSTKKGVVKTNNLIYNLKTGNPAKATIDGSMTYLYSSQPGYYYLMNTDVNIKAYPSGSITLTPACSIISYQ